MFLNLRRATSERLPVIAAARSAVAAVVLVGALVSGSPATAGLPPDRADCATVARPGDGVASRAVPSAAAGSVGCVLARADVTVTAAGQTIYLRGKLSVNDVQRTTNTGNRDYVIGTLRCFDHTGTARFGLGSITNVWDGIGTTSLYPTGVFVAPYADTWTCDLEANNGIVSGPGHTYYVTAWYLNAAPHSGGLGSIGSKQGDPAQPHLFVAPGTTYANGDKFLVRRVAGPVAAGVSTVTVTANTNLTTCSFNSDDNAGCPQPALTPNSKTATVTVHLWAWQTSSATDDSPCPANPAVDSSWTGRISSVVHHYTVGQTAPLSMVSSCGARVVVKTEIENTAAGPYLHVESGSTAVGYVY